jgi:AcrR family transcriptional regulator
VVLQARAEATRRKIIDSAVELFGELGYGETGLADVLQRAGVSKGAFYYHFDSREAVAAAIIDEYNDLVATASRRTYDGSSPTLGNVIRSTFVTAAIVQNDPVARIGHQLMQALGQISTTAARVYGQWTTNFTTILEKAITDWRMRDGVQASDVAEGMWACIVGSHLISTAVGDDVFGRLARSWRLALLLAAPDEAVDRVMAELDQIASDFQATVAS